jgi:acetolactate synthase I/II/III large subunit
LANTIKASDLLVKQLEEEGVEHVFGLPGEENLSFLESLRTSSIKVHITRHEQAAAFRAATYGRLTKKAGVCFSTLGPGATNLVTGIAQAQLIGAPLVAITGQKALRDNWQARFQLIDVVKLMQPITKKSVSIVDPSAVPTVVRNAFKLAQAERPGAVHIELPEDVAESVTDAALQLPGASRRPAPDAKAVAEAARLINGARRPLILLSGGANRNLITEELVRFLEKTRLHAVHTQMGKGVVSDASKYSLFTTGMHRRDYVNCGLDLADLIITIGYHIVEYPPYVWNRKLDKKIVHIDFTEAELDKYYNPVLEVVGDVSLTLRILGAQIAPSKNDEVFPAIRTFLIKKLDQPFERKFPPTPQEVIWHVRNVLTEDDIVALDNGIYKLWFCRLYKTYKPNTFLVDNALASMGAGLASAMTAKMLNPERKVLAVVGDGGFMMNAQELETAIRCNIPVVALILNDNAFGFVKWEQQAKGFTNFGVDYGNPDFPGFAESFGAAGFRVREGDDLSEVLREAFALRRPALVECPIDYSVNYATFSQELANLQCEV